MNTPASTLKASGRDGAVVGLCFIALAILSPDSYRALPPGASETVIVALSTLAGYFKNENVLKLK